MSMIIAMPSPSLRRVTGSLEAGRTKPVSVFGEETAGEAEKELDFMIGLANVLAVYERLEDYLCGVDEDWSRF